MRPSAAFAIAFLAPAVLIGIPLQYLALKASPGLARQIPNLFHRWVNHVLGIRRTLVGAPHSGGPLLMASSHASWLDITVLSAIAPVSFVAKSEVGDWPLFGLFARLQRTVFVDRTRRSATGRTTAEMAERLGSGDALVLFPEGTSNDGNRVYPFRSALLGAASAALTASADKPVWVQPVAIVYRGIHGVPGGRRIRPRLAWYGDMDLAPHLLDVLAMGAIDVTVVFGDPVLLEAAVDRKALARELERNVRAMAAKARSGEVASAI
ncbi:1-acyl-sn-glycerol-3-phosphate acyltransferase [Agaricicola taiwanensis]|uniref:1-acyl-sn-glycerol-3-phosphate acyltransferase n=1 Tax=Agaricicola taiwanensis TaxID=591372 RepID=A0A8J2VKV9_9RHOB|nr:lysophospholipid acyltransferase family protein [Agaricicola taiwanensis]GGE29045.1 1-acyl-sn-glycerol-3-phosphate acyltransferase [Agaricicola taiwanensis]